MREFTQSQGLSMSQPKHSDCDLREPSCSFLRRTPVGGLLVHMDQYCQHLLCDWPRRSPALRGLDRRDAFIPLFLKLLWAACRGTVSETRSYCTCPCPFAQAFVPAPTFAPHIAIVPHFAPHSRFS